MTLRMASSATTQPLSLFNSQLQWQRFARPKKRRRVVTMRDRSNNPRPLQKGRNLSIEAIQTVQTLKRSKKDHYHFEQAFDSKFRRLLKLDMMSVLRELLRQNECVLALKVFEEIRREIWYKPQVLLYSDMIQVLGSNGFVKEVELLYFYLKNETNLKPEVEGFNPLLRALLGLSFIELAMECYCLMKQVGCEPDRSTFRILVNGFEAMGETTASGIVRMDAQKYYGESLDFLDEEK